MGVLQQASTGGVDHRYKGRRHLTLVDGLAAQLPGRVEAGGSFLPRGSGAIGAAIDGGCENAPRQAQRAVLAQPVLERFTEGRETARYRTVPVVGLVAAGLVAGFIVTLFVYF